MTFTEILADARRLVKAKTAASFSTSDITESANRAIERATHLIRQAEGRWQWDDLNNTSDFPIATTTIVADQQDYSLDGTSHFQIERVEVTDSAGGKTKLIPFDEKDIYNQPLSDFLSGTGVPQFYDKVGNSLFLYPTPSYTLANGLKLYFERGPSYFTTSDTTKTPGFNPLFHRLCSLWAAYDYAYINQLGATDRLLQSIATMENQLTEHYSLRDKDEHVRLRARPTNYR